jgi:hypothetical protein
LIIPDAWRVGLAVFALRMASRRCFLTAIAVLALAILLVAMTAAGGPAQAVADALLIDTDTIVAFGNISGEDSRTMDVGTTPEGTIWFRVRPAVGVSESRERENSAVQDALGGRCARRVPEGLMEGGRGEARSVQRIVVLPVRHAA